MKKLKSILKPVLRGAIKTIPYGNVAVEFFQNWKAENKLGESKPHNYVSMVTQILGWSALIYAFYTHVITLDQLLGYIGFGK